MTSGDISGAVELQRAAFPPPFSEDLHWGAEHLARHIEVFPEGQWVAVCDGYIVGSCSNCIISESLWQAHGSWASTVGGPFLEKHSLDGTTLYGLDITVHPGFRKQGIGRAFYSKRFGYVRSNNLTRYGTGCRIPDYISSGVATQEEYCQLVAVGEMNDRTMTPLLRMGLCYQGVIHAYMTDGESGNAAAMLEWLP